MEAETLAAAIQAGATVVAAAVSAWILLFKSLNAVRLDQYELLRLRLENETEWEREAEDTRRRAMDELKGRQARLSTPS
jgi:hypothetical protein